jgi:hypothetical protein
MSLNKNVTIQKWSPTVSKEERAPVVPDVTAYPVESTWMVPFEFQAPNKTNFLFKAGNKTYALDGTSKNGGTSELGLRKKYGY